MFEVLEEVSGEEAALWFMFYKRNQRQEAACFANISCCLYQALEFDLILVRHVVRFGYYPASLFFLYFVSTY